MDACSLCCTNLVISPSTLSAVFLESNWAGHLHRSCCASVWSPLYQRSFLGLNKQDWHRACSLQQSELSHHWWCQWWCGELQFYQLCWYLITAEQSVFKIHSSPVLCLVISWMYKIICCCFNSTEVFSKPLQSFCLPATMWYAFRISRLLICK